MWYHASVFHPEIALSSTPASVGAIFLPQCLRELDQPAIQPFSPRNGRSPRYNAGDAPALPSSQLDGVRAGPAGRQVSLELLPLQRPLGWPGLRPPARPRHSRACAGSPNATSHSPFPARTPHPSSMASFARSPGPAAPSPVFRLSAATTRASGSAARAWSTTTRRCAPAAASFSRPRTSATGN